MQLERFLLFSSFAAKQVEAPERVRQHLHAHQKLRPHRLQKPEAIGYNAVIDEPMFFNRQLFAWEDWARLGLVRSSHLRHHVRGRSIRIVPILLAAMTAARRQLIQVQPPVGMWLASLDQSDLRVLSCKL